MQSNGTLLTIDGVSKQFYGVRALKDVSLAVEAGTIFGIVGPNGAGKTTLFNIICGVYPPTSGKISLRGKDITSLPASATARQGVARTFQIVHSFRSMTVLENVMVGCGHKIYGDPAKQTPPERPRDGHGTPAMVGLEHQAGTAGASLSPSSGRWSARTPHYLCCSSTAVPG